MTHLGRRWRDHGGLADIHLGGDVPRVRSHLVYGVKKLPVEVTLA